MTRAALALVFLTSACTEPPESTVYDLGYAAGEYAADLDASQCVSIRERDESSWVLWTAQIEDVGTTPEDDVLVYRYVEGFASAYHHTYWSAWLNYCAPKE